MPTNERDAAPAMRWGPQCSERDGAGESEARRLRRDWAEHLAGFEWAHFATLTTRLPATPLQLRDEFERGYVRRLARMAQGPVPWFHVIERGAAGIAHVHVLLAGTEALRLDQLRWAWKLGMTDVERYDAGRGAAYYLTKSIPSVAEVDPEPAEYDVSRRMPPRCARPAA